MRLELTPLIDVIFLLLTFFIFALVLMVRADVLGITLPELGTGTPAERAPAVEIAIDQSGVVRVAGETVELDAVGEAIDRALAEGDRGVRVAVDERAPSGVLVRVAEVLAQRGVASLDLVGRPAPARSAPIEPPPAGPVP